MEKRLKTPTIVAKNKVFRGTLLLCGDGLIEGKIIGTVLALGKIILSPNGSIEGTLIAPTAVIFGRTEGLLIATLSCSLYRPAFVSGKIIATVFSLEEGANVSGTISVEQPPIPLILDAKHSL